MWVRITLEHQLAILQPGTIIVKYPIDEQPAPDVNDADKDNTSIRVVVENDVDAAKLVLGFYDEPIKWFRSLLGFQRMGLRMDMSYNDILETGLWWVEWE